MSTKNQLFILSSGRVAAINKNNGTITWEVNLRSYIKSFSIGSIGQLSVDDDKLYIGISGVLLCLDARDGAFLWKNELKGWGYRFINMANATGVAGTAVLAARIAGGNENIS